MGRSLPGPSVAEPVGQDEPGLGSSGEVVGPSAGVWVKSPGVKRRLWPRSRRRWAAPRKQGL